MSYKKFLAAASAALTIIVVIFMLTPGTWAQSKGKTLYEFTGGTDGSQPFAGVVFDQAGNLYGTTYYGGTSQIGTVFELSPKAGEGWKEKVLYDFTGSDGAYPLAGVVFDQAGSLYGTTQQGGDGGQGPGNAFMLAPKSRGTWAESVLFGFCLGNACSYGDIIGAGLIFDEAGNLYGTTQLGGDLSCYNGYGCGVVFQLTPNPEGSWTENVLYSFTGGADGGYPVAGLIFDTAGNLYGTAPGGGVNGDGVVFELTPNPGGPWTESVLYSFCSLANCADGSGPSAGLIFDSTGRIYGTAPGGGAYGSGVVFKLTPNPDGSWKEKLLHQFTGGKDGGGPGGSLIFDKAGNLYGAASNGGAGSYGVVFKLAPNPKGGWNETVLDAFGDHPGAYPTGSLVFDAAGNLYGTTSGDRATTFGTVFEITP
jgi:uncharacterized repeat protein (TIGR03803 family)